jgi:hypothetical protein
VEYPQSTHFAIQLIAAIARQIVIVLNLYLFVLSCCSPGFFLCASYWSALAGSAPFKHIVTEKHMQLLIFYKKDRLNQRIFATCIIFQSVRLEQCCESSA